jgi:hypothetical protein
MYALAISNPIRIATHMCDTMVLKFKDDANAYGYSYQEFPFFYQKVRLGIDVRNFKFPTKQSDYLQSNGRVRKNNVVIQKSRELFTDPMDEATLEDLNTALRHSEVYINDIDYTLPGELELTPTEVSYQANGKATLILQQYIRTNISCQ